LFFIACGTSRNTATMIVASKQGNCQGEIIQKCYLIKTQEHQKWEFFYDEIQGFDYKEGYEYKIKVAIKKNEKLPQETSDMQYKLLKIISKKPMSKGLSLYNTWILSTFGDESNMNSSINKNSYITLIEESNRFNGNGGCNRISGKVSIAENKIDFKNIMSTKMACENLKQETTFVNALERVTDFKIVGCELFLYEKGKKVLVLENCR